jgi:hypothetical protein
MIFSKQLLFVHVPKTAGMSISSYLLEVLPAPVYSVSVEREDWSVYGVTKRDDEIVHVPGGRHGRLAEAFATVRQYDLEPETMPLVLVGTRNPYELEVSRYAYLQAGHSQDRGADQDLAMEHDFETFALETKFNDRDHAAIDEYYTIAGRIPENVRIVRYERLPEELLKVLSAGGITPRGELPWENRSWHDDWRAYYTPIAAEAVYQRYRWVFDQGWYDRIDSSAAAPPHSRQPGHLLPIVGEVKQVGSSSGFSHRWVMPRLEFRVRPYASVCGIVIRGWRPADWGAEFPVTLSVDGTLLASERIRGPEFEWWLPGVNLPANAVARLSLDSPAVVRPCDISDSPDGRALLFELQHIEFVRCGGPLPIIGGYMQMIARIRGIVSERVPAGAKVAVASRGDDRLLEFDEVSACHFPQVNGAYAGHHPADSAQAITQLESLRATGVTHMLFPRTSLWWLDYYEGLREHLDEHCDQVVSDPGTCRLFALTRVASPSQDASLSARRNAR